MKAQMYVVFPLLVSPHAAVAAVVISFPSFYYSIHDFTNHHSGKLKFGINSETVDFSVRGHP
jgi:hypothetical protein